MPTTEQLETLLSVRRLSRGELVVGWQTSPIGPPLDAEQKLAKQFERIFREEYGKVEGDASSPMGFVALDGQELIAQFRFGQVSLGTRFSNNYATKSALAMQWVTKHWSRILSIFADCNVVPRFLALIVEVDASATEILEDDGERALVAQYLNVPSVPSIADAEFRISLERDARYYLNFGFSTYKTIDLSVDASPALLASQSSEPMLRVSMKQKTVDRGLRVKIDTNTKVNLMRSLGPITITNEDFKKAVGLTTEAIDTILPSLLLSKVQQ